MPKLVSSAFDPGLGASTTVSFHQNLEALPQDVSDIFIRALFCIAANNNLAALLQDTNRLSEAEPLMRRALAIDEASFGSQHPNVARDLNNLARLLQATNRLSEAEPLMRRAVEICERSLGPDHPNTKIVQENLAVLLAEIAKQSPPPPAPSRVL